MKLCLTCVFVALYEWVHVCKASKSLIELLYPTLRQHQDKYTTTAEKNRTESEQQQWQLTFVTGVKRNSSGILYLMNESLGRLNG